MVDPLLPRFDPHAQSGVAPFFFMHEGVECVKIMIAGETRFTPVFRAEDMWEMDGLQEIKYKDRWPDQYRQFKEGASQIADGTPLDEAPFLNPSRIAELRQLKVYSIEALANMDERNIPRLGGKGYDLKRLAGEFLSRKRETGASNKISAMQAEIDALKAMLQPAAAPPAAFAFTQTDELEKYINLTDDQVKDKIAEIAGQRPRGNPSRATLVRMLDDIVASSAGTPE